MTYTYTEIAALGIYTETETTIETVNGDYFHKLDNGEWEEE